MKRPQRDRWLGLLLSPFAWLYGMAIGARNRRFDRPGGIRHARIPVISVGNLTVGGTGKTPVVAWIAKELVGRGRQPAIVSRGYGGRAGRGPFVVSRGAGPLCAARICGDEPLLLARNVPGAIVVVGSDRFAGADAAAGLGADVAILDDGFQHRGLARDADLLVVDGGNPFGNGRLLPAGPLREPADSVVRADLVLITRSRGLRDHAAVEQVIRRYHPRVPVCRAGHDVLGFVDGDGRSVSRPSRAVAFCGIGQPSGFRSDLEDCGVELAGFRAFSDHHRYSRRELARLAALARRAGASLVTTEKDLARLGALARADVPLSALRIAVKLYDPRALLTLLDRVTGAVA